MPKNKKTQSKSKRGNRWQQSRWSWFHFLTWRRMKWVFGVTAVVGLFFTAWHLSFMAMVQNFLIQEGFTPKHIYVVGRDELAREVLTDILKPYEKQSILHLDERNLASKIQALDWVETISIKRYLPNTLVIVIEEGKPVALWQHDKEHHLIDQKGKIIKTQRLAKFGYLPVLVGETAPKRAFTFFESVAAHPELKEQISAAIWVGNRRWDVHMKNGIIIKMPENSLTAAWDRLAALNEEHRILHRAVEIIDLRLPDRLILEMKSPKP